jgi:hypothetical protein
VFHKSVLDYVFQGRGFSLIGCVVMRQARVRESSGLIKIKITCDVGCPHLAQGQLRPPSPGPGAAHVSPHSLIIGWESLGSALPTGLPKF